MFLEEKLRCIRMQRGEGIEGIELFVTRIQEVRDQLVAAGAAPQPSELVRLTLNSVLED